ncbi:uncharacterized protein LOC119300378 [Triticum dicoccoides]|nr:uncharacterized protein LOC119300378 [Triticum dicoccoides]
MCFGYQPRPACFAKEQGEHLRAELFEIEAQAKSDLEYARSHGVIKPREARPGCTGVDCPHEGNDEERKDRVRSLAAAALAVVEQAMDNPELFEGIFDQARAVLSGLGVEGYTGEEVPRMNGNGNNTPQREENDGINWEDLERESQELVELENCQPCTDAQLTIVAPAVNG